MLPIVNHDVTRRQPYLSRMSGMSVNLKSPSASSERMKARMRYAADVTLRAQFGGPRSEHGASVSDVVHVRTNVARCILHDRPCNLQGRGGVSRRAILEFMTETAPESPAALARQPETRPRGATLGRYILLDRLGAGGMGVVYAAYDPDLDRKVAVKILHEGRAAASAERQARLQREAQAMAHVAPWSSSRWTMS